MRLLPSASARLPLASLVVTLWLAIHCPAARADEYQWGGGDSGNFDDMLWSDLSDNPIMTRVGPPGGGDGAGIPFPGDVLSVTGGGVDRLAGGTLNLAGSFSVNTIGSVTVMGAGNLTAGTIGPTEAGSVGTEGGIKVIGASVTAGSAMGGPLSVSGGGSLVVKGSTSQLDVLVASDAMSLLEIDGTVTNAAADATGGATVHVGGILYDGTSAPDTTGADGTGSTVKVDGDAIFHNKVLSVTNGGQVTIGGSLGIYADTAGVEGGASLQMDGAGSTLTAGSVSLGPGPDGSGSSFVGFITLSNGALLHAGSLLTVGGHGSGEVSLSNDAAIQVDSGLGIAGGGNASLDIESGSGVTVNGSGTPVGFGFESSGNATVTISAPGSFFNAPGAAVRIGVDAGSSGSVELDTDAQMTVGGVDGAALDVGVAGSGSISINGGNLNVAGSATLDIGVSAGSSGSVGVQALGGLTLTGPAIVGDQGTGSLGVNGAGNSAAANGDFFVGGDGTLGASTGNGTVSVSNGAQLTIGASSSSTIGLGNGADAVGEIYATDAGSSLTLNAVAVVGAVGVGEVAAANGATVVSKGLRLGAAGVGTLLVYNQGTVWTETAGLDVGGPMAANSSGVAVNDGGLLRVNQSLYITSKGVVTVTAELPAGPAFPYPPPPTTTTPNGRIFVGTDNVGPDGAIRVGHGGRLKGKGKQVGTSVVNTNVIGKVVVGLGGKFQPGGDPDVFSIQGDCDLSDGGAGGGETDFEIGGAGTAGTDYDQLIVSGTATLGGTLNLVLLPGYVPKVGDTFNFIQAGTTTGSFAQISAPGLTISPVAGSGGLSVTVTAVTTTAAPVISSASAATGYVGLPFAFQVTASNSPAGYTATGLPGGLTIDAATGLISGTPTTAGVSTVSLTATNTSGTGTGTLTLTATAPPAGVPTITSTASATGQVGTAFSYQITASNGPASFGATGLPVGLSLNAATGLISGTPTAAGVSSVTLSAINPNGTGTAVLALVIDGPALPTVTATATVKVAHAEAGTPGVFTISLSTPPSVKTVVKYTLKGSAVNGTDYNTLTGKAKIKPGKTSTTVQIVPKGNAAAGKTVKLVITPNTSAFTVGNATAPKIKIKP